MHCCCTPFEPLFWYTFEKHLKAKGTGRRRGTLQWNSRKPKIQGNASMNCTAKLEPHRARRRTASAGRLDCKGRRGTLPLHCTRESRCTAPARPCCSSCGGGQRAGSPVGVCGSRNNSLGGGPIWNLRGAGRPIRRCCVVGGSPRPGSRSSDPQSGR